MTDGKLVRQWSGPKCRRATALLVAVWGLARLPAPASAQGTHGTADPSEPTGAAAPPAADWQAPSPAGPPADPPNSGGLLLDMGGARQIAARAAERPLGLDEVLRAMAAHQPQVAAAHAAVRGAQGAVLAAEGGFDPRLSVNVRGRAGGYYDLLRASAELRQPTALWGAEFYGRYRLGLGLDDEQRFPTYYGDETLASGELAAGVELPLWRDGPTDRRRTAIARREQEREAAEFGLMDRRFHLTVAATAAYYRWAAAAHGLHVAERLLGLARERAVQLARRAVAGSVSDFDVTDNERMLVSREDKRIAAQRAFEAAAINLSLYHRDTHGRPRVSGMARMPPLVLPPELAKREAAGEPRGRNTVPSGRGGMVADHRLEATFAEVVACHPRLARLRALIQSHELELGLAENQVAPEARAYFQMSRDLGDPDRNVTLPGTVWEGGLRLSFPLLLRTDRGKAQMARAKLEERRAELLWGEDLLRSELQNAQSRLQAAVDRVKVLERLVAATEALAVGERQRNDAGASTLLVVNLREQAAADAANRYLAALAEAHAARAEWRAWTIQCEPQAARRLFTAPS